MPFNARVNIKSSFTKLPRSTLCLNEPYFIKNTSPMQNDKSNLDERSMLSILRTNLTKSYQPARHCGNRKQLNHHQQHQQQQQRPNTDTKWRLLHLGITVSVMPKKLGTNLQITRCVYPTDNTTPEANLYRFYNALVGA